MAQKILIIDDEPRNVFALTATLRSRGYDCISASSAKQGLALLNSDHSIGIVLIDMMMPEMDGYEAIPLIRNIRIGKDLLIVAVTAQAMTGDREKCLLAGAHEYISKPINVDLLFDLLQQHI